MWVIEMINKNENLRNNIQIVDLEGLVPKDHLLRKIDTVVDSTHIYDLVEDLYCHDNGRPSVDPVVLVKMVMIQHLYGIKSLRQTVKEIDMNIAYRWFLGYDLGVKVPHFSTISYNFAHRFTDKIFEQIFTWILENAMSMGYVKPETVFIDATHIKANANKKKNQKIIAKKAARVYEEQLRAEINEDRENHGKKPLKDNDEPPTKQITVSTVDPECGLFHKGEHKKEMAYTTHTACDRNNFILDFEVTAGNMRYTLYRGLTKVTNWVRLKFACMNLKKLAMWAWNSPVKLRFSAVIQIILMNIRQKPCFHF